VAVRNTTPMPAPRPPKPSVPPKAPATTALATPKPAPAPKPKDEAPKQKPERSRIGAEIGPHTGLCRAGGRLFHARQCRARRRASGGHVAQVGKVFRVQAGPLAPRRRPRGRWRRPSGRAMPMPGCNAHPDGMGS
jgi:rare lipoprotein A